MPTHLTTLLLALTTTLTLTHANPLPPTPALTPRAASAARSGKVALYRAASPNNLDLGAQVGCLDVNGRLVLDSSGACATYTVAPNQSTNINIARTAVGECGFHFADEPRNPDVKGSPDWSAFRCKKEGTGGHDFTDQFGLMDTAGKTYVVTVSGSGANYGVFTKGLPKGNGDAVDVFTRGFDLGAGSIDMLWVFNDA